ncbi:MAG TPA: hypothetical protein DD381_10460 [Lentisphaeria bacterium]|nr:MAG: hypothetical protein A2X47_02210 [Lentisphaerae bacterium GWF2_38_69]HBM16748.1 hypothetical protein [Lentisphaeria bacterium]
MEFKRHVKWRTEKFGAVIFETLKEKLFITNDIGADILKGIGEGKAADEIVRELAEIYNCDKAVIQKDVNEYIASLTQNGIIAGETE